MHDRITLGGAASLAMPMIALFAWLRDDVRDNRERLARIETGLAAQHADLTAQGRRLDGIENAQSAMQDELAALHAGQAAQGRRLDGIETAQSAMQDELAALHAEQAAQGRRLDGIETAQSAMQDELAALHLGQAAQGRRLDGIENAQAALQAEQTAVRERLARIDGELSGLAKWLQGIFVFGAPRQNALRAPPADPGADAQSR